MQLIRRVDGVRYDAPGHWAIAMTRLIGPGALDSGYARLMHLRYDAEGRVDLSASAEEKIYYCIRGEVTIFNGRDTHSIAAGDVFIVAPGEGRQIVNRSPSGSELLLIMPR